MAATAARLTNILPCFPSKDLSAFHVESLLGSGGFSHVVLARDSSGAAWAMKLIPAPGAKSLDGIDGTPLLLSEARIHLLLSGEPSVLPCVEAFKSVYVDERDPRSTTFMAVLRMPVAACSVEEWLFSATPVPQPCQGAPQSQVDETEVLSVWLQMVNAVHRCHDHGIVHKDIKLPNFLMDNRGKVQIMDFGLAHVEGVTPRAVAGTPWTMSPAGLKHGDDGRAGDWWALGVVLYQLLQGGAWPFKHCWWPWQKGGGERMEATIRSAVLAGRITFTLGARVSEPVKALIRGLLQPDPNRRWQLRQVLACEVVKPELLSALAERFPELAEDMHVLQQLQRRARGVQALGSDGGAAAAAALAGLGLGSAGSAIAAAATSVVNRARGMSALVGDGGLHWPHWGPGVGRAEAASTDGSSYRPLLEEENREEGERPVLQAGPSAFPSGAAAPGQGSAGSLAASQADTAQQRADSARVGDLLLLFPTEGPDACPSQQVIAKGEVLPQLPQGASRPAAPPGLVSALSEPGDVRVAAHGCGNAAAAAAAGILSPLSSGGAAAGVSANARHASTASMATHAGSFLETSTSGRAVGAEGRGDSSGSHVHSPRLSRRSLTGPQFSPTGRRSDRTSLHDLFGARSGSHSTQPLPLQHHAQAISGGGAGGHPGEGTGALALSRGSWAVPRGPPPWHQPPGSEGRSSEGAEPGALPPQSSWVPPPPEAFAGAAAAAAAAGGRISSRGRAALVCSSGSPRNGNSSGASTPRTLGSHHPGFFARARRLFSDCLPRTGVKYDIYSYDELKALPTAEKPS